MSIFFVIILLIVLACMVMVLLAIRQLTHYESFDDAEETNHLKEEVEEDRKVISEKGIFRTLIDVEPVETKDKIPNKESGRQKFR